MTILISEVEPSNVISCSLKTVVSLFISFGTACIWGIHGRGGVGNTHLDQLLYTCFPNTSFMLLSFPVRPLVCRTKKSQTFLVKLIKPIIKNKSNSNKWKPFLKCWEWLLIEELVSLMIPKQETNIFNWSTRKFNLKLIYMYLFSVSSDYSK